MKVVEVIKSMAGILIVSGQEDTSYLKDNQKECQKDQMMKY